MQPGPVRMLREHDGKHLSCVAEEAFLNRLLIKSLAAAAEPEQRTGSSEEHERR